MIRFERSVVINRPVEQVFAFTNDLESDPQWRKLISRREKTSAGPVGVGTTFRDTGVFLGRQVENNYEITEYEPNQKRGFKSVSGSFPVEGTWTYEPVAGGTRITEVAEAELAGFFKLAEPIVARMMKRILDTDLANLKDLLEAQA